MKRREVKVTLSPNEEAQLIREEQKRRRILRIQQVREQQRSIAQCVRQKVEQRRQQEMELLVEELRAQWEQQQKERVDHLQRLYQDGLSLLGQSHRNAKENEPDLSTDQKAENDSKAEERFRKALKELKLQRLKSQENQSRSIDARRKALEVEKTRSAKVASLPLPPQPLQETVSKPQHVVKKCDATSFAATHYHMPETMVDRETTSSQPSARVDAAQEVQRMTLMQRQEEQRKREQQEKALLRGREALRREQLLQDRGRLLVELEHMQQTDLLRRRQQVGHVPRQIFEPLYRRQETQLDVQRDMEFAFEDMYSGERRVKGDLLCGLVPEPLPPPSTDSLCQDLDVTQESLSSSDQHTAESEAIRPGAVEGLDSEPLKAAEDGKAAPPRRGLKRLLSRIQTQRQRWSESEAVTTEPDSTMDTGSLAPDRQSKADVEHSAAVAEKTQELDEQRRRGEQLEAEKREQMDVLETLEQQRLQLELKLNEAQRERALLKISATPSDSTDSTPQSVPVTGNHTKMMTEHRRRLLQQNEIHQRSVQIARQRLEEYQKALRIRYNILAVPPTVVPPPAVPPAAVSLPAVTSLAVPSTRVLPAAVPQAAFTPSGVTLRAVTHSPGDLLRPEPPRAEEQTPPPPEAVSRDMGPLRHPPHSNLGPKTSSDSLAVLRHRAFLKFLQDRLSATESDQRIDASHADLLGHPSSQLSPPVSMATSSSPSVSIAAGPSVPSQSAFSGAGPEPIFSSRIVSSTLVSASSPPSQVVSSAMGPSAVVSTVGVTFPGPTRRGAGHGQVVPMAAGPSGFLSFRVGPGSVLSTKEDPEHFLPAGVHPDPVSSIATNESLELWDNQNMTAQPQQEVDVPALDEDEQLKSKELEQERSSLLQALLRALERSNIGPSQPEDSDPPSISGSRSASSGSSWVVSLPPSAAPKPPVSRARLVCVDSALHQLSVIEEVTTPASVSLLTGEDAVIVEEFQNTKQANSSASTSCSLSDFAQFMDSPQSLDSGSVADYSGSSAVSSFKHPAEPGSRPQPSLSTTLTTGSYITTDPELHSQSDSVPAETPGSSPAQQNSNTQEELYNQGQAPQTQFAPVETVETLPTEEPSVLETEDSFRPLVGQMSDQSVCPGAEDGTLGLEALVGHPSAHSSVIEQMPGCSPLMAWDSSVSRWREGLPYAASGTWPSREQKFVPTERHLEGPENETSADASTSSGFHQLQAEVTNNETETTEPPEPGPSEPELWSPEQMRPELFSHGGLSQCSPPDVLYGLSFKGPVEVGILDQSQITLLSLTDSSSDEQEPGAEEGAGLQCHQIWSVEEMAEHSGSASLHSLGDRNPHTCDLSSVHKLLRAQDFHKKTLQRLRSKEKPH